MLNIILFMIAGVVFTWLFIRMKGFLPIEKLICWLLAAILVKMTFTLEVINLNWIAISRGWTHFVNIHLSGFLTDASMVSLLMSLLWSGRIKLVTKIAIFFVGVFVLAGVYEIFRLVGDIRYIHWNFWYSVLHFTFKVIVISGFFALFRIMLNKEGVRT